MFLGEILASLSNWFESLRLQDGSWLDMSGHESYYLMGSGDASEEAVSCFPAGPIARMFSCFLFSVRPKDSFEKTYIRESQIKETKKNIT